MRAQRKIFYKRYLKPRHFCPAPGYNCPKIPLGGVNHKGPDYEVVRVVKSPNSLLKGRLVLISWGLNLPEKQWPKLKQVLAFDIDRPGAKHAEIVLAVD